MKRAPAVLYHYTSPAALVGILSENRLRATNFLTHNDHSELIYGLDIAAKRLEERLREKKLATKLRRRFGELLERLQQLRLEDIGAYYASLSENGNLLSQWRTYAGTQGFALGFRAMQKRELTFRTEDDAPLELCRVLYDSAEQAKAIDEAIESSTAALDELVGIASAIKHAGFSEEREWRITFHPPRLTEADATMFRIRAEGTDLVSYVELLPRSGVLPISCVVCGPGVYVSAARQALQLLLKQSGYRDVEIETSDIPAL